MAKIVKCIFYFTESGEKIFQTTRPLATIPPIGCGITITTETDIILSGVIRQIDLILDNRLIHDDENIGDYVAIEVKVIEKRKAIPANG